MTGRDIVDVHAHIGRTVSSGIGQTVDEELAVMDRAGIAAAVISVAAGGVQAAGIDDTRRANDVIAQARRDHPDRFLAGLGSVEVRHGDAGLAEVDRVLGELRLDGLAFHATFEGFSVDSAAFEAIVGAIGDCSALLLIHSTPDAKASPAAIGEIAGRYPRLQIVLGHPVFTPAQRAEAAAQLHAHENLWLDVAYQDDPATTAEFVGELGAHRVLFGSDAPFFAAERVIASIDAAGLAEAERDAVLGGNAYRLLSALRGD